MGSLCAILKQQKPSIFYVLRSVTLISDPALYMHVFYDEWILCNYNIFHRLYRFLPRILIVAHSTLQKRGTDNEYTCKEYISTDNYMEF
jgi:hypothetical protein